MQKEIPLNTNGNPQIINSQLNDHLGASQDVQQSHIPTLPLYSVNTGANYNQGDQYTTPIYQRSMATSTGNGPEEIDRLFLEVDLIQKEMHAMADQAGQNGTITIKTINELHKIDRLLTRESDFSQNLKKLVIEASIVEILEYLHNKKELFQNIEDLIILNDAVLESLRIPTLLTKNLTVKVITSQLIIGDQPTVRTINIIEYNSTTPRDADGKSLSKPLIVEIGTSPELKALTVQCHEDLTVDLSSNGKIGEISVSNTRGPIAIKQEKNSMHFDAPPHKIILRESWKVTEVNILGEQVVCDWYVREDKITETGESSSSSSLEDVETPYPVSDAIIQACSELMNHLSNGVLTISTLDQVFGLQHLVENGIILLSHIESITIDPVPVYNEDGTVKDTDQISSTLVQYLQSQNASEIPVSTNPSTDVQTINNPKSKNSKDIEIINNSKEIVISTPTGKGIYITINSPATRGLSLSEEFLKFFGVFALLFIVLLRTTR